MVVNCQSGVDIKKFEEDFLSAHNKYRKLHGSPPLQLSQDLCKSAQKWADHLLSIQALDHSDSEYGENIHSYQSVIAGNEPVDSWYSEIENYDFNKPGYTKGIGHFTQVVWKDSKEVGVGVAAGDKPFRYVVAQYNPAGNIDVPDYFEKNVLPGATV
ncbi:Golgi-associated plant pathogenesis-related protein 1 [Rhinoderma darwinii]|uniref:Golgi-associated plant pathogenesis-related protein 1 n=1 Tax=Rhinoderma darwinii TaxID=43563 RepID=UPI003F66B474